MHPTPVLPSGPIDSTSRPLLAGSPPEERAARGWSLERRLPLMILALLAIVVVALAAAAYSEVRRSTIERTTLRLEGVAQEIIASVTRTAVPRYTALRALATRPEVSTALATEAARDAARAALPIASAADSVLLGWELWTTGGALRVRTSGASTQDSIVLADLRARFTERDTLQRSRLYSSGTATHLWTMLPVRRDGRLAGVLAELRRLPNSSRAAQQIRRITGEEVTVYYSNRGGDAWASLRGEPVAVPLQLPDTVGRARMVTDVRGTRQMVVAAAIPASPWTIVLVQPEATILRRPQAFLRNLLLIGLVLLIAGTVGAWALSRHVTRPLRALGDAADAMAHGDYSYRVRGEGGAEMAQLADTFNAMAARIGDAHAVLAHQNAELERAVQAKTRFLAIMSHELRTPLNAIGGYAELLSLGVRGPILPAQVDDLMRITRNKDQLLSIIGDILHFSRVDAGYLALRTEDVALADMFERLADAVGPQFAEKRIALEFPATDCTVRADTVRLQQVLVNLLTNAYSFTPPGGRVSLACTTGAGVVHIAVRDTGQGIPATQLEQIFEPFVQVDSSLTRRVGGTGLGLSIVRELTAAMGGTIAVSSVEGEGSVFTLSLPMAAEISAPAIHSEAALSG